MVSQLTNLFDTDTNFWSLFDALSIDPNVWNSPCCRALPFPRWEILKPSSLLLPEPKHSLEGEALEDGRSRRKDEQVYWEKESQEKDKPILRVLIRRARKGLVDGQAMLCSRTSRLAAYFIRSNFILCSPKLANSIFFRVHILLREVVLIFAERVSQQTIVQSLFRNMPFHPSVNYIWKRELSFEEMSLPGSLS